jgi:hypothetical protein
LIFTQSNWAIWLACLEKELIRKEEGKESIKNSGMLWCVEVDGLWRECGGGRGTINKQYRRSGISSCLLKIMKEN